MGRTSGRAGIVSRAKKGGTDKVAVLVTCGSRKEALRIGRAVIEQRLAACANVARSPMDSVYRWKGKIETTQEFLLIMKTSRARFDALQKAIRRLHSYDLPEIIALPVAEGEAGYLAWIAESVKN